MATSFTAQQRKDITRRQVRIEIENTNLADAIVEVEKKRDNFLGVDDANKVFFDEQNRIVSQYETERAQINGEVADTITESQIQNSGYLRDPNDFYPFSNTPPFYTETFPKVIPEVNGNIISNLSIYENQIIPDLTDTVELFTDGYSDSPNVGQLGTGYDPTGFEINLTSYSVGTQLLIRDGNGVVFCEITDTTLVPPSTIVYESTNIIGPTPGTPQTGADVTGSFSGFSDSERRTKTASSSSLQPFFDVLVDQVDNFVQDWIDALAIQKTQLENNEDTRTIEETQNNAALSIVNGALSSLQSWQALPETSTNHSDTTKYNDAGIAIIETLLSTRDTATRVAEINAALGQVDVNDPLNASTPGIYFARYRKINIRINRITGSLIRAANQDTAIDALNATIDANIVVLTDYDEKFRTEGLARDGDGTNKVYIESSAGFGVSDNVTVLSETQPELNAVITNITSVVIDSVNLEEITLDTVVPDTYVIADVGRIFKEL